MCSQGREADGPGLRRHDRRRSSRGHRVSTRRRNHPRSHGRGWSDGFQHHRFDADGQARDGIR